MASVRRSVYLSAMSRYASMAIGFVSVMIVARLLTPEEIGIFSVSAAFVAIGHTLRDFGVANYVIQERDLTKERVRQAFGVSLLMASAIAVPLVLSSGLIAGFYDQPRMVPVIDMLALNFLLIPLCALPTARLRREMKFGSLIKMQVTSTLIQAGTTVTLAYNGASSLSMAGGAVAGNAATFTMLALFYPGYAFVLPTFRGLGRVVRFGGLSSAAQLYGRIGMLAPDFILGRMLGFEAVAFYSRGDGLINLFRKSIHNSANSVAQPAFAARHRKDQSLKDYYLRAEELMSVIAWPFLGMVGLMAFPIIRTLYGPQWDQAVPITQLLCIGAAIGSLFLFPNMLLLGIGNVKAVLYKEIIVQTARIATIVVASFYSLEAVALALIGTSALATLINYGFLRRIIGLRLDDVWRYHWKSFTVALVSLIGPFIAFLAGEQHPELFFAILVFGCASCAVAWLCMVFAVGHPAKIEVMKLIGMLRLPSVLRSSG